MTSVDEDDLKNKYLIVDLTAKLFQKVKNIRNDA